MIYWPIFIVSAVLLNLAEQSNAIARKSLALLGLALPIILASLRDPSIGRDNLTYVVPLFDAANSAGSLTDYLNQVSSQYSLQHLEVGFIILGYAVAATFHNLSVFFGVLSCLTVLPVYAAVLMFRRDKRQLYSQYSTAAAMLVYYGVFYNISLSVVRQSIACAIVLLSAVSWMKGKRILPLLLTVIAWSIHQSGIIGLFLFLLISISSPKRIKSQRFVMAVAVAVALPMAFTGRRILSPIISFLWSVGALNDKFVGWEDNPFYIQDDSAGLNVAWFALSLFMLLIMYALYRRKPEDIHTTFLFIISILALCSIPLGITLPDFGRISLYFLYFGVIVLPLLHDAIAQPSPVRIGEQERHPQSEAHPVQRLTETHLLISYTSFTFLLIYWTITVAFGGSTDTANYLFFWQSAA
jgi:hypothetical protein